MAEFEKTCRFCLLESPNLFSLFGDERLRSRLKILPPEVKISPGDGFPSKICDTCSRLLNEAYTFRNQCLAAHSVLAERLSKNTAQCKMNMQSEEKFMKNESTMTDIFQDFPFVVELPFQWSVYIKCIQIAKDNEFIKTLSEFVAKRSDLVFPEIAGKSIKQMDIMVRMLPSLPSISWNNVSKVLPPVIDLTSDDEQEDKLIITKYPYIDRPINTNVKNKAIQTDIEDMKLCLNTVNCKEIQSDNEEILTSTEKLSLNTVNNKEIQMDDTEETSVSTDRCLSSDNHLETQTDSSFRNTCELKRKSILKKPSGEPMNKVRKIPENIQGNKNRNVSNCRSNLFNTAKWKKMLWSKSSSVQFAKHLKVNRVVGVKCMRCNATFHNTRDFETHHESCVNQPLSEPGTSSSSQTGKSKCSDICEICGETFSDTQSLLKHTFEHIPNFSVKKEHTGDESGNDSKSYDENNSGFESQEGNDEV